jgi:ubiquinone/menaquinone biosynthesis C-methylase UbiE
MPRTLGLTENSHVLEIGCGSGWYALRVAESVGCRILGLDSNEPGIRTATQLAREQGLSDRVQFEVADASEHLAFQDGSFDAAFSNDVFSHIPGRLWLLRELRRVLKRGARVLFSDAPAIGGMISHQEIAIRSSIGYYFFSPPGRTSG